MQSFKSLSNILKKENPTEDSDWFSASESDIASEILAQQPSPEEAEAANDRFANQLNGKCS